MSRRVLEKVYITNAEARRILEEKISGTSDNILLRRVSEYLARASKCVERAEQVREELVRLGLSRESSVVVVNVLPRDLSELRSLLLPADRRVDTSVLEKALEVLRSCY